MASDGSEPIKNPSREMSEKEMNCDIVRGLHYELLRSDKTEFKTLRSNI